MPSIESNTTLSEPKIFPEQYVPDHVFVYIETGSIHCYDGSKNQVLNPGEYYLFRKYQLIRYFLPKGSDGTGFIRLCLEEALLKKFWEAHRPPVMEFTSPDAFIKLKKNKLIPNFIRSLKHIYYQGDIEEAFTAVKQEELLIILLQQQPELAGILFDFGKPQKIDLEEFMLRHYKFNVSIDQFAYLTGRSLSAFKRDFNRLFNQTPSRWLVQKRLQEAYFLLHETHKKPSEIYLGLGFESFSHFSFAFKKQFGLTPTKLTERK
ncbi:helix-turn-helix domain-containing protein [Spirosoma pollinicola]|uniref:AraC family transcriptional regulator n=1 Tax=Spirosoma pollinicola TaxID=2057025 RepID=A0A2K8Z8J5_9BACT|nr:AraC family transcriptional regulator [Spirosoma pollinicola]AUD06149.1 AraC family transcriptional regulator [Spirosoma pollinicola]